MCGMPLGGIGTGCIDLETDGTLVHGECDGVKSLYGILYGCGVRRLWQPGGLAPKRRMLLSMPCNVPIPPTPARVGQGAGAPPWPLLKSLTRLNSAVPIDSFISWTSLSRLNAVGINDRPPSDFYSFNSPTKKDTHPPQPESEVPSRPQIPGRDHPPRQGVLEV